MFVVANMETIIVVQEKQVVVLAVHAVDDGPKAVHDDSPQKTRRRKLAAADSPLDNSPQGQFAAGQFAALIYNFKQRKIILLLLFSVSNSFYFFAFM
ncbi:hypothetical protein Mgra_00008203 [Meloidogyne graminicola]|uniref:Uncharacterized protein n=1 Tax=Meloidogyne graminicola TaxID=189291 RepID=A0A8S9ZGI0_9BILA|nr:hypothetical protein Mgra_00008203 [Meloidogyne graminicola]